MTKNYYYDGDRLIAEKWSTGAYLLYHYDETGSPYAITYSANGSSYAKYYLIKNLQGDVLQIRNVNNTVVANYEYDAWGKVVSVKYANGNDINVSNHFGVINPIRYRGYYYDSETGFYYLKSRYYDPAIGRFISTDGRIDINDATTNLNLFAYCGNDPVNRADPSGDAWYHWVLGAAVVAACAVATVATCGGFAAAAASVCMVASGTAAASTAATVATSALIGSATVYGTAAVSAAMNSSSLDDFADQGDWGTVAVTAGSAAFSGLYGYGLYKTQSAQATNTNSNACPSQCFVEGTLILSQNGLVPIEKIKIGDFVWSTNIETGESKLKIVLQTFVGKTDKLIHIYIDNDKIISTPTHPFYSPQKGWISAVSLKAGDFLVNADGDYVVIKKIQHELLKNPISVYNFETADFHTYYVSTNSILCHNKCKPTGSYEIEFQSGKNYVGKGSSQRMEVSAKLHRTLYNDPVVSKQWTEAANTQEAFVAEYFKMSVRGVNNSNTYNLIWSPGRKIFMNYLATYK